MATQSSAIPSSASKVRNFAYFHPSLWENHFLNCPQYEQKRGHIASAVQCYMKQYGVSEEEAIKVLNEEIEDSWKDINEELILMNSNNGRVISFPLLESILNLVRTCNFLFKDGDRYTNSYLMKGQIATVLKDPVLL
ncbi:Terpene synthase [Melia azedarach]|uniref:Terpene synthase n=1 Tax=Melia azedarach TaxID=155640 RepID=A0ACC1WPJ1_MELAZ|nr:Terpene synthase [Melia azedarach]